MELVKLLKSGGVFVPWPTAIQNEVINGQKMTISALCVKNCGDKPKCHVSDVKGGEHCCGFGLSFYRLAEIVPAVTIFGIRGPNNPKTSAPHVKEYLKGRLVTIEDIVQWRERISTLSATVDAEFLRRQSEMLDPLHDSIRLTRQIHSIAQRLVQAENLGGSFDEQVERTSPDLKSLVKASDLLSDSFDYLTIFFNPEAASYGRKSLLSLHGLLRKLVSILSVQEMDDDGVPPVRVFLNGSCYRSVLAYESFKLVPFALISNAVKYSMGESVRVGIIERAGTAEVSVESIGPYIEPDELLRIFGRRERGKWAERYKKEGAGIGLYLAKIVADANGFAIRVTSNKQGGKVQNGVPVATNRFSFEVKLGAA